MAIQSIRGRQRVKLVLVLLIIAILIIDVFKLKMSLSCDNRFDEYALHCHEFATELTDFNDKIKNPQWFIIELSMFLLYFSQAIIFLPFIYVSMNRLKVIDVAFHKNSRCRVFLCSSFFSFFLLGHIVLYYYNKHQSKSLRTDPNSKMENGRPAMFVQYISEIAIVGIDLYMLVINCKKDN